MTGFYEKSRLTARSLLQAGVHLTLLTLTGHIRAHQRDIIGLTMVIPWALKRPILSILKCLGVCNRLVRLNCHKKIYCDNEFTYYIHLKTYLVIYSRKFSSAHFMSTVNPMMSSWWPDFTYKRPSGNLVFCFYSVPRCFRFFFTENWSKMPNWQFLGIFRSKSGNTVKICQPFSVWRKFGIFGTKINRF